MDASFRFYAELNEFLPRERQYQTLRICFNGRQSVKHLIESSGIPHTEVDLVLVNGRSVDFSYLVQAHDRVAVYPVFESMDITPLLKLRRGQYSLIEEKVHPQSVMAGKRIEEIKLPDQCVLIAVLRKDDMIIPHGKVKVQAADEIIALAHSSQMDELDAILGPAGER